MLDVISLVPVGSPEVLLVGSTDSKKKQKSDSFSYERETQEVCPIKFFEGTLFLVEYME